jgi:hypothetical protein
LKKYSNAKSSSFAQPALHEMPFFSLFRWSRFFSPCKIFLNRKIVGKTLLILFAFRYFCWLLCLEFERRRNKMEKRHIKIKWHCATRHVVSTWSLMTHYT